MAHRVNAARDARIRAAYAAGTSRASLAARHGLTLARIGQIIGPVPRRRSRLAPIPVVAPDGTVLGASLAEAAAALGVTYQAVREAGAVREGVLHLHRIPGRKP